MEYRAKLNSLNGRSASFTLLDDLDYSDIKKHAVNGQIYAYVDFTSNEYISNLQRKHLYALFRDMEDFNGNPMEAWESKMKYDFMNAEGLLEFPSLARNAMSKQTATKFIDFVLNYCINNGIPFKFQEFYLTADVNKMLYALTLKRICWITGKPNAQLHHAVNLVQMGNNRNKFNHLKSRFMMLSAESHQEAHTMGYDEFCSKYHVSAIKLSKDDLKKLGVRGKYE